MEGDAPLVKIPFPLHPVPAPVDDIVDFTSSPGPGRATLLQRRLVGGGVTRTERYRPHQTDAVPLIPFQLL